MTRFEFTHGAYEVLLGQLTEKQLEYNNETLYCTFVGFIEAYLHGYSFHITQCDMFDEIFNQYTLTDYAYALREWLELNCGFITSKAQCQKVIEYILENKENLC